MLPSYGMRFAGTALGGVCALQLLLACESDGAVEFAFLLPDVEELSPAGEDVASVTLVTYETDAPPRSETRRIQDRSEPLDIGRIEVADEVSFAVELRSPTLRLLGYGRSASPVDVLPYEVVTVPIMVRRPFVYVAGGTGLATFDATLDQTNPSYRGTIGLPVAPELSVPTHDGANLAVVAQSGTGAELLLVSTANHQPLEIAPVLLAGSPTDAAVSPDNQYVVVAHTGGGGGLSIVDLESARQGESAVDVVPLGAVGGVAIGARAQVPRAVALVDRATSPDCVGAPDSSIVVVSLTDAAQVGAPIEYGGPIHDLAVSSDGSTAVIADACNGLLATVALAGGAKPSILTELPSASAVAVIEDRVWGVGTLPPTGTTGRRLTVVSIGLDGTGEIVLELPPSQERARSLDFSGQGQAAEQRLDADTLMAYDLAVVPGADQIALLTWGYFSGSEVGDLLGAPIIPAMELTAHEYLLLNASTGAATHRVRTSCALTWESDPFNPPILDAWECTQAAGQDVSGSTYLPQHISVLYGTR